MPSTTDYIQLPDGRWVLKGNSGGLGTINKPFATQECLSVTKNFKDASLLSDLVNFIRRFVVLSLQQAEIIVLWIIHTYMFEYSEATPYLNIHSPEKRSGKTRLLEILDLLVTRPWFTGRVTAAVLARKVDAECPTLLLDESDAAFKGDKEYSETLRAILNTGYRKGGKSSVCVGQGTKIGYRDLSTFCPKAIAGIGKLPQTIADRSIPILLKRRAPTENIERFRRRIVEQEASLLRERINVWVNANRIENIEVEIPPELNDRAADCLEPLLIIADKAGAGWMKRAHKAAVDLMTGETHEDDSQGVRLLADIKSIFKNSSDQISSADLIAQLRLLEEAPWNDLNGHPMEARQLASLLKPYGIRPQTIRVDDKTPKGYRKEDFEDAWNRYLPPEAGLSATSATLASPQLQYDGLNYPQQTPLDMPDVADKSYTQVSLNVTDVADEKQENGKSATKWEMMI